MPRYSVNEGTTAYLAVAFKDKAGAPATPTAVEYRIDCLTSSRSVRSLTTVAAAASIEITLEPIDNLIFDASSTIERRRVTVVARYGAGSTDQVTGEHDYDVRNLPFLTT